MLSLSKERTGLDEMSQVLRQGDGLWIVKGPQVVTGNWGQSNSREKDSKRGRRVSN